MTGLYALLVVVACVCAPRVAAGAGCLTAAAWCDGRRVPGGVDHQGRINGA